METNIDTPASCSRFCSSAPLFTIVSSLDFSARSRYRDTSKVPLSLRYRPTNHHPHNPKLLVRIAQLRTIHIHIVPHPPILRQPQHRQNIIQPHRLVILINPIVHRRPPLPLRLPQPPQPIHPPMKHKKDRICPTVSISVKTAPQNSTHHSAKHYSPTSRPAAHPHVPAPLQSRRAHDYAVPPISS